MVSEINLKHDIQDLQATIDAQKLTIDFLNEDAQIKAADLDYENKRIVAKLGATYREYESALDDAYSLKDRVKTSLDRLGDIIELLSK